jgi:PAS domain S-box-containing protein
MDIFLFNRKLMPNRKKITQGTISRGLAKRLFPLALTVAFFISVLIPLFYCLVEYNSLKNRANTYAKQFRYDMKQLVEISPDLWKYQSTKFSQIVDSFILHKQISKITILDEQSAPISQYSESVSDNSFFDFLAIQSESVPIMFNNKKIGEIQISLSVDQAIIFACFVFIIFLLLGIPLSLMIYRLPLNTVNKLECDLQQQNQELNRQTAELASANVQLENEKRLLTAVMEALPTGVAIIDQSGGLIRTNKAYDKIWGRPGSEVLSIKDYSIYKAWWADSGEQVAPEEWAAAIAVQNGKESIGQVMKIQRFDGTYVFVINSASPVYDTEGNIAGCAVAIQDVTKLKQVERSLFKSEQWLRLFIEYAPVALAMFDRNMCYLSASRRWASEYGLEDREFLGLSHYDVFDIPEQWKEIHRRGLTGEVLREDDDRFELPDGSIKWLRWEIHPWLDLSGNIGGIVIFTEDVTIRKQAEEQLQNYSTELERKVEQRTRELQETQSQFMHSERLSAIGKLSASIAHEFNNPLQGVMTILKGLKRRATMDEEDKQLLDLAIEENVRMKTLIQSLQDFSQPPTRQKVPMDVHASIDSLLLLHRSDFKSKNISTVLKYAEKLPRILAIPDQIKQVFLNLLNNAADACRQNGGVITISTWQEEQNVAIAIEDTGTGIPSEIMGMIFQPFFTTKDAVKGTGLGLSVCHGIVQNHQGEIRVESKEGEGSTFIVILPIGDSISMKQLPGNNFR